MISARSNLFLIYCILFSLIFLSLIPLIFSLTGWFFKLELLFFGLILVWTVLSMDSFLVRKKLPHFLFIFLFLIVNLLLIWYWTSSLFIVVLTLILIGFLVNLFLVK